MSARIVYFNGQFLPESAARLSIYDSALLMGDMAYEVTRTFAGRPFRLEHHLERLFHSLTVMQISAGIGPAELLVATHETLERNLPTESAETDWTIIHNVSRGPSPAFAEAFLPSEMRPSVLISCFPLDHRMAALAPVYAAGVDLVIPAQRSLPSTLLDAGIKTRSRWHFQHANLQANEMSAGATAVLLDPDGYLTEGTSGNLFLVKDGRLRTPTTRNLLPGVTRKLVLELAAELGIAAEAADLTAADAAAADEIFLTSTSIGVLFARSLSGRPVGDGRQGPVTSRLQSALHTAVEMDIVAQANFYAARLRS